jgi:hypothetical protein
MPEEKPLTKVAFRDDDDGKVETLWAYDLGEDLYQLDNTPWYQYGVSWKDVIEAVPESEGGLPLFRRVVEKSGYRTLRVSLEEPATDEFLDEIKQLGCGFEGANRGYFAIDIPPERDLQEMADFLTESDVCWEYADPTYEGVVGERPDA